MADYGSIRKHWNRIHIAESAPASEEDFDVLGGEDAGDEAALQRLDGTFIASGAEFEGTLKLKGDFRIDTEFRGELATDGTITVGPQGTVVGSIDAREVIIGGAVVGKVVASRQLIRESTGKLHGDIETACLEIQKHAFFKGQTAMTQPLASLRQQSLDTLEPTQVPAPL
jgi:cytoskeletal protein CcmA (bactofilin family)